MGCLGDSRLTLPCAAWKGWVDLISELQGMGAGQRDPRQESHRGGCGLARDLDGGRCSLGQKAPKLHCHTAALCWPREHYAQAARPGPWKWLLGGPPPQEAHGAARIFIVLKAQTASRAPKSYQSGGGADGSLLCSAPDAWTTSGGRCRGPVPLSAVPEAAQWVVGLHLLDLLRGRLLPLPVRMDDASKSRRNQVVGHVA